jgi:hypothetical protein
VTATIGGQIISMTGIWVFLSLMMSAPKTGKLSIKNSPLIDKEV